MREWAEFSHKAVFYMQLFVGPFLKSNNNCWPFFDVQRFERSNKLTVHSVYLFVTIAFCVRTAKDSQQLINGRIIVGIVIKICVMLQIFLPTLENRELLMHVIATKSMTQMRDMSMTIYYSEQNRPDKSAMCKHSLKQILTLLIITTSKHFVLACALCNMPHAYTCVC